MYISGLTSHIDLRWDFPPMARFLERLASFSRLILLKGVPEEWQLFAVQI